jgi:hypothetical protein
VRIFSVPPCQFGFLILLLKVVVSLAVLQPTDGFRKLQDRFIPVLNETLAMSAVTINHAFRILLNIQVAFFFQRTVDSARLVRLNSRSSSFTAAWMHITC